MRDATTTSGIHRQVSFSTLGSSAVPAAARHRAAGQIRFANKPLRRRQRTVGLVMPDLQQPFCRNISERLHTALRARRCQVLTLLTSDVQSPVAIRQLARRQRLSGIVYVAPCDVSVAAHPVSHLPTIFINNGPSVPGMLNIGTDIEASGRAVAALLAESGHRRALYLAAGPRTHLTSGLENGFLAELAARGLDGFSHPLPQSDYASAVAATEALFAVRRGAYSLRRSSDADAAAGRAMTDLPDAVLAASDEIAIAVIETLRHALGLRVPDDVAVVGVDGSAEAERPSYRLTTIEPPIDALVAETVTALFAGRRLQPTTVRLPGVLRVRATTLPTRR